MANDKAAFGKTFRQFVSHVLAAVVFGHVFFLLSGCDAFRAGSVGYANSPLSGRHHAVIRVQEAIGTNGLLWNVHAQARIGSDAQLIGVGAGILRLLGNENAPIFPHVATGATVLEIGRMDRDFAAGVVSPYVELGLNWLWAPKTERKSFGTIWGASCLPTSYWYQTTGFGISLTGTAQYDVRVTEQPNDFTWRLNLGITRVTRQGRSQRMPALNDCGAR